MIIDLGLLIGLISIALALFLGLFFNLTGFSKGVTSKLSAIKEAVIAMRMTVDKTQDFMLTHFSTGSGTVERELENLGKVRISVNQERMKQYTLLKLRNQS